MVERDELARRRALSVGHPSVFRRDARRVADVATMTEGLEQRRAAAEQRLAEARALLVLARRRHDGGDDDGGARLSLAEDRVHAAEDRLAAAADRAEAARLLQRSRRDGLTGAVQRDVGEEQLVHELAQARRDSSVLVVAFVDLDGLKRINDTRGHQAGDGALRAVGAALSSCLRSGDLVVRYGGDEFVCALPGIGWDEACSRFDDVRRELRHQDPPVSISVGLALVSHDDSVASVLRRADEDLYAQRRPAVASVADDVPQSGPAS
jgi:diguanylate cyclase (GGDEF)-like protein